MTRNERLLVRARRAAAAALIAVALAPVAAFSEEPGAVAPSADMQARAFTKCRTCHSLEVDGAQHAGPNLHGLFGSKAGTRGAYEFSGALKQSGIEWSEQTLDQFLKSPQGLIPGNRMAFAGLMSEDERKAVIAYLKSHT